MFLNGITFRLAMQNARANIPHVLELLADGRLDALAIEPQRVAWDDAPEVLADHRFKLLISR
jgi:threonine dehydrogenase-like Zn-dependent dehydrogenase